MSLESVQTCARQTAARWLPAALIAVAACFLFAPRVHAHFLRVDGPVGWGYGYGYGFTAGYGWDEGTQAGVRLSGEPGPVGVDTSISSTTWHFTYNEITGDYAYEVVGNQEFDDGNVPLEELDSVDDGMSDGVYLGFDFPFYGETYGYGYASTNGFLTFNPDSYDGCCNGLAMPDPDLAEEEDLHSLIAGFWTDLSNSFEGARMFYRLVAGEPGESLAIFHWEDVQVRYSGGSTATVSFRIVLEESGDFYVELIALNNQPEDNYHLTIGSLNQDATRATTVYNAFHVGGRQSLGLYGYGYGYGLPLWNNANVLAYDAQTNTYDIPASAFPFVVQSGLIDIPGFSGDLDDIDYDENEDQWMSSFVMNLRVRVGEHTVYFPQGTILDTGDLSNWSASASVDTTGVEGTVRAALSIKVNSWDLTDIDEEDPVYTFKVNSGLNGQSLAVWSFEEGGWWLTEDSCTVSGGFCVVDSFDNVGAIALSGGTISSGGGGGGGGSSFGAPQTTSLTIAQPTSGTQLAHGSSTSIVWYAQGGIAQVRVSLSYDGGTTWSVVLGTTPNSFLPWTVPNAATQQARIRLEGLSSSGSVLATAVSQPFTITGTTEAPVTVVPPTEGTIGFNEDRLGVSFPQRVTREEANAALPAGIVVDDLIKVPDDGNPVTQSDTTVYYVGMDARRHPFPSAASFLSWYPDFGDVKDVTLEQLSAIPLGSPIMPRPGTHWVKIQSDPKTYFVSPGYVLHHVADEATAALLGGPDWNRNVVDIEPTFFPRYLQGQSITLQNLQISWPSGALLQTVENPGQTYLMTSEGLRLFADDSFAQNRYQERFILKTSASSPWNALQRGNPIASQEDRLWSLMH